MPRTRPLGPPPYERPNWETMNEGQRRYAMEQWNLARVRRGEYFIPPQGEDEEDDTQINNIFTEMTRHEDLLSPIASDNDEEEVEAPPQPLNRPTLWDLANMNEPMEVSSSQGSGTSSVKRKGGSSGPGGKAPRRSHGSALPGTSGNLDGMETAIGGAAGTPHVFRNAGLNIQTHKFYFTKQWKFTSFGVANVIIDATDKYALTTALVDIPWQYAFMYMSPAEWNRMKMFPGIHAKSCHIKITQFNPRVAFNTGETLSQTATLNQNKFLLLGKNLKGYDFIYGRNNQYKFSATEVMKPDSIINETSVVYRDRLKTNMYGYDNDQPQSVVPAAATGHELELAEYFTVYIPKRTSAVEVPKAGFPPVNEFCEEYNAMDFVGKEIHSQSYQFKYAPILPRYPHMYTEDKVLQSTSLEVGTDSEMNRRKTFDPDKNTKLNQTDVVATWCTNPKGEPISYFNDPNLYTHFALEQQGLFGELNDKKSGHAVHPSLHVGVRAVPKLTTADQLMAADSWLDTQMYYYVNVTLELQQSDPFTYLKDNCYDQVSRQQYIDAFDTAGALQHLDYDGIFIAGRPRLVKN